MYPLLAALDRAADGAFLVDAEQRIVYWNPAAAQLLGFTAQEVLGKPCYEVIPGLDEDERRWCRARCRVWSAAQQGKAVDHFRLAASDRRGDLRWFSFSVLVLPLSENDGAHLVLHLFHDVSDEQHAEAFAAQVLELAKHLHLGSEPGAPTDHPARSANFDLTDREHEVLTLMAKGCSTGEIAEALSISVFTVRNHIQNILQKLQVHSRSAAVALAFERQLVSR